MRFVRGADRSRAGAQDTPRALAAGTVLQGRYLVGFVRTADAASMLYAGFDLLQEQKVLIREFFPGMYCTRSAGEDSLTCFAGEKTRRFRGMPREILRCGRKPEADSGKAHSLAYSTSCDTRTERPT